MIYGIQKLSLVDYPGKPAFVLFLGGCNFRCPYCHNNGIVQKEGNEYSLDYVLSLIQTRVHFLNGIVVTGGEPTIYGEKLISLLEKIRILPLSIKLDTNGSNPKLLKEILKKKLVDYVAMDLKNSFEKYETTTGVPVQKKKIIESIQLLENSDVAYEFRMTINKSMHTEEDIEKVKSYLKYPDKLFLQPYQYNKNQIVNKDFKAFSKEELKKIETRRHLFVKN